MESVKVISREDVIRQLKESGFWNEESVEQLDSEYVDIMLDIYRFTKAEADACCRLKDYELRKALANMIDNPRPCYNEQEIDIDLGLFAKR